jgi:hypothetical protein
MGEELAIRVTSPARAVFVSYASEDAVAAERIAAARSFDSQAAP